MGKEMRGFKLSVVSIMALLAGAAAPALAQYALKTLGTFNGTGGVGPLGTERAAQLESILTVRRVAMSSKGALDMCLAKLLAFCVPGASWAFGNGDIHRFGF
jgi:hypothetical protein